MRNGAQRHHRAIIGIDVDRLQRLRICQKLGIHLEDDVVLIDPHVDVRDLPLPEGIIQRAIDRGHRNA